ncbi:MAG TPA: hypothetical protein VD866_16735 [Urbifossiella sp.]|nr:hypothetical protein [Urbifossiella sp.]
MTVSNGDLENLIRFRCEGCGNLLGADPAMRVVICARCRLDNPVPSPAAAAESRSHPVRVVSADLPWGAAPVPVRVVGADLPWRAVPVLGLKLAVAAAPVVALVGLVAFAVASLIRLLP